VGGFALMRENAHVFGLHQPGSQRALKTYSAGFRRWSRTRLREDEGSIPALGTQGNHIVTGSQRMITDCPFLFASYESSSDQS